MGQLYLVRHAQASFGAADYDQLSTLGERQSLRLGEYFAAKGIVFEAAITGSLRRHAQTFAGIAQGAHLDHTPLVLRGLNEYDSAAVIASAGRLVVAPGASPSAKARDASACTSSRA